MDRIAEYPARYFLDLVQEKAVEYHQPSGSLLVFRNADVRALLRDPRLQNGERQDHRRSLLSPAHFEIRSEFRKFLRLWPAFSDGPYHARLRAELVSGLTRSVGTPLLHSLDRAAEEMLSGLAGKRSDWVRDFAQPYAIRVLDGIIDAGMSETATVTELGTMILNTMAEAPSTVDRIRAALSAVDQLENWLKANISLPSPLLVRLRRLYDDVQFGSRVATAAFTQVVTGSIEPVVTVLAVLAERVGPRELREIPTSAIREEVFRLATPFRFAGRSARCSLEVSGHRVAEGDRLSLNLATANVDPLAVPDPLLLTDRGREKHVAFGLGTHYCAGVGVARAAVDTVVNYMKSRGVSFHCETAIRAPELPTLRYRSLVGTLC